MPKTKFETIKVMLVDNDSGRSALLSQALLDHGYEVIARVEPGPSLLAKVAQIMPDMIVIDTESPDRDILESMYLLNEHNPLPVVMFADEDNETVIQEAIKSGVSGYIVKGVDMERVKPIMSVAIARFREYQALKDELKQTKSELEQNKLIDKAKRLLMQQKGVTEQEAYEAIRKRSMDSNQKLYEVAETIISVLE
ncbi:ANTAR domain-containing response regulator [Hydrogenovibrio sp. JE_KL2]|jgi:response regulator NasT|uniref:ANTAR domain-containing response regulator n=1 Tax=Hydrogenovibrio sp. JE_KL2 TaxID=2651188 RepID=UPI00128C69CF|nr:ANTAR domain-containing protein [Hydrogenovibrio sp. JE_KL2]MBN2606005.1 ANTAR domain-containing protein [Thiotrichales bacterium]MPQ76994.1 ANTAR domain-containing protein [Hydrogenovibrio sp. JE_KL2]